MTQALAVVSLYHEDVECPFRRFRLPCGGSLATTGTLFHGEEHNVFCVR